MAKNEGTAWPHLTALANFYAHESLYDGGRAARLFIERYFLAKLDPEKADDLMMDFLDNDDPSGPPAG